MFLMTSYIIVRKYIETGTNVSGYDRIFPHWKLKIDMSENDTSHLVICFQARSELQQCFHIQRFLRSFLVK